MNRQVNTALAEGLVERERPEGSAAYRFARSAKGRELFEADVAASLDGYRQALDLLGEPETGEFLRLLGRFTEAYRDIADRSCRDIADRS